MITEWLLGIGQTVVETMASWWPPVDDLEELESSRATAVSLIEGFNGYGVWVDWTALGVVVAVAAVYGVALTIRLVRAIIAHVPFVGGSGA